MRPLLDTVNSILFSLFLLSHYSAACHKYGSATNFTPIKRSTRKCSDKGILAMSRHHSNAFRMKAWIAMRNKNAMNFFFGYFRSNKFSVCVSIEANDKRFCSCSDAKTMHQRTFRLLLVNLASHSNKKNAPLPLNSWHPTCHEDVCGIAAPVSQNCLFLSRSQVLN